MLRSQGDNFTADKWIASISKVKKGNENYTSLGSYNKYERYGKNNTPYLAIKNIKSSEGYIIGTEDLTTGNNFARKIADTGTLKIEVRAKNGDDISFDHIMNEAGKDLEGKGYDPRKLLAPGAEAIKQCVKDRMEVFGCIGKA